MDATISRFSVPDRDDLPPDLAARLAEVADKSGFVPHIFLALAHRPDEWRAFFAYHDALMDKETPGLTKADREIIVVATSAANSCLIASSPTERSHGFGPATRASPTRSRRTGARPNSMTGSVRSSISPSGWRSSRGP